MKRDFVAGFIALLVVLSSALVLYVFIARTASGQKTTRFNETVRFLGQRIDGLERQRDLLADSAATLEAEAESLRVRVRQIDAEIQNMRELLAAAGRDGDAGSFNWRRLRITTASGLVIIAFLAFIWMLYNASRRDEFADEPSPPRETAGTEEEGEAVPGSVLEEEFAAAGGGDPGETPAEEEAPDAGTEAEPAGEEGEEKKA